MDAATSQTAAPLLEYDGRVGDLYRIFLVNILLMIVTLGIWRFWGVTRYRRYLWSRMRFQGERFEYTGTGGELFRGFLLALAIVAAIGAACWGIGRMLAAFAPRAHFLAIVPFYLVIALLALGAPFSAQRYRLSRTHWRGIRGGMTGSMLLYGVRVLLYGILLLPTLFQLTPWVTLRLAERRINASSFGDVPFIFRGHAGRIYPIFLATGIIWFLSFVVIAALVYMGSQPAVDLLIQIMRSGNSLDGKTFGLIMRYVASWAVGGVVLFGLVASLLGCWYNAVVGRHIFGNTRFATLQLSSAVTGWRLFVLLTGNFLIALFTLGLGFPFLIQRDARFLSRNTLVAGYLDATTLHQSTLAIPRTGEGMLNLLDGGSTI